MTERQNVVRGLIAVTSEIDCGKSVFATSMPGINPSEYLVFNSDIKDENTLKELGIPHHDLTELAMEHTTELKFHDAVIKLIDAIPKGKFRVIVWDVWKPFEMTFKPYVEKHKRQFSTEIRGSGAMVGGILYREARRYEGFLINQMLTKADTLILTSHLKPIYLAGHKTDIMTNAFSPAVHKAANLMLWLRKAQSPCPTALVSKRLATRTWNEDAKRIETVSVLPRRLEPLSTEHSLWDSILRYLNDPIAFRTPTAIETLSPDELNALDGVLSDNDKQVLLSLIEHAPIEEETTVLLADEAKMLQSDGKTTIEIAQALKVSVPEVAELLK